MAMFTTKHIPQKVYMNYIGHPIYTILGGASPDDKHKDYKWKSKTPTPMMVTAAHNDTVYKQVLHLYCM